MRPIITTLLVLLPLALPAALAAAQQPQDELVRRLSVRHCGRLIWQFDSAARRLVLNPNLEDARARRTQAERLCNRGNPVRGIEMLEAALFDIGINPLPRP